MKFPAQSLLISLFTLATVVFLSGSSRAQQNHKIQWQSDPQAAAAVAAEQSKPVMLHFTATWCGPCQNQKRFLFSNPTVAHAVNQSVVPVMVDIDENRELAGQLGVTTVPFDVFLTAQGEVINKRSSPKTADSMVAMVKSIRAPDNSKASGAMAKLAELKRKLDPMSLPRAMRSSFGAAGPGSVAQQMTPEAADLKRKSNFRNKFASSASSDAPTDIQAAVRGMGRSANSNLPNGSGTASFFKIAEHRTETETLSREQRASVDRVAENIERHDFLARQRNPIQVPTGTRRAEPVRVMNDRFLAANKPVEMKASSVIPGLQISEMIESPGLDFQASRESVARIDRPVEPKPPVGKATIVPQPANARDADLAAKDAALAAVANVKSFEDFQQMPTEQAKSHAHAVTKNNTPSHPGAISVDASKHKALAMAAMLESPDVPAQMPTATATARFVRNEHTASAARDNDALPARVKALDQGKYPKPTVFTVSAEMAFGLQGKCPVTLVNEGRWVDGDPALGIVHRDRTYLFQNREALETFRENPDSYSPVLSGFDPVIYHQTGQFVDGKEENGVFMERDQRQQIVLFATDDTREQFQNDPQTIMRSVRKAMVSIHLADQQTAAPDTGKKSFR